ncbi:MAG: hypothetical protein ACAI43_15155 [Phycisphaerae bacterium]
MRSAGHPIASALLLVVTLAPASGAQFAVGTNRETTKTAVSNYRVHGSFALDEVVRVRVVDGLLAPEIVAELPVNESVRLEVEGSPATWVARNRNIGGPYLTLTRYDFDVPAEGLWSTSLTVRANGYVALYAQTGDVASGTRVRLIQSSGSLRLTVTEGNGGGVQKQTLSVAAQTLQQLQAEQPDVIRRYVAPALRAVSGTHLLKPGAVDVYRLFPQIAAPAKPARALEEILPRLDAPSYAAREQASRDLSALGPAGVLAVLRRPRADLSEEAVNRLSAFLASQTNLAIDDVDAARRDPYVLLDCLADDDAAVRAAAKDTLAAVLGAPVAFDPAADEAARNAALEAVRRQVETAARPKGPVKEKPEAPGGAAVKPKVWLE